jgi:hypothetical protein
MFEELFSLMKYFLILDGLYIAMVSFSKEHLTYQNVKNKFIKVGAILFIFQTSLFVYFYFLFSSKNIESLQTSEHVIFILISISNLSILIFIIDIVGVFMEKSMLDDLKSFLKE